MAEQTSLGDEESFIDALSALVMQTSTASQAMRAAVNFWKLAKSLKEWEIENAARSKAVASQQSQDVKQDVASSSIPKQSVAVSRYGRPLPSTPYSLAPTYTPALDEHLPLELRNLVSEYQDANFFFLKGLEEYSTFMPGQRDNPDRNAVYYWDDQEEKASMTIKYEDARDSNGLSLRIPHVTAGQYRALMGSMCFRLRRGMVNACDTHNRNLRAIFDNLETAIAGRSVVHDWYRSLPAKDVRVADNVKHAAFLETLLTLRNQMMPHVPPAAMPPSFKPGDKIQW